MDRMKMEIQEINEHVARHKVIQLRFTKPPFNFIGDFEEQANTLRGILEFKMNVLSLLKASLEDMYPSPNMLNSELLGINEIQLWLQNNKQLVISSDRPPKAIAALESRLVSRFEQGMLADVGSPDFETRIAILESKAREKAYQMERDILHHIASVVQTNVRELEGALNKVIAFHQFKNLRPTLDSVKPILTSFQPTSLRKTVTPKQLIHAVSIYFDVRIEDLLGKSRQKKLAFPRQIIMYLMREEMKSSYPSIGNELGGRDHTTAMHAYEKITGCLCDDEKLQNDLELIKQRLYTT
jgi:chromosomal replication initiator protein